MFCQVAPAGVTKVFEGFCEKHGAYSIRYLIGPDGKPFKADLTCPKCKAEAKEAWTAEHATEIAAAKKAAEEQARLKKEHEAAKARQKALEDALQQAAIPLEYEHATFETYHPTTKENAEALRQAKLYANNFSRVRTTGVGLFLYGATGTGKSHIACSILKTLLPDVDGVYCMTWQVIQAVKEAPISSDPLRPFLDASFLILDEIGVQNGSRFEESVLYPLIDTRVANRRPTIFISNIQPDAKDPDFKEKTVRKVVGERIWDRMQYRSIFLRFTGESYRKRFKSVDELLNI